MDIFWPWFVDFVLCKKCPSFDIGLWLSLAGLCKFAVTSRGPPQVLWCTFKRTSGVLWFKWCGTGCFLSVLKVAPLGGGPLLRTWVNPFVVLSRRPWACPIRMPLPPCTRFTIREVCGCVGYWCLSICCTTIVWIGMKSSVSNGWVLRLE